MISINQVDASDLKQADLVVMGSPTHEMNLPETARPLIESLPRRILKGTPVAVFDTSYKMTRWMAPFTAARKLASRLRKLGGKGVVPPETYHVEAKEGPLYEGEMERAEVWAASILRRLEGQTL